LLVEEHFRRRPPYGVVVLADARQQRVASASNSRMMSSARHVRCGMRPPATPIPDHAGWAPNAEPANTSRSAGPSAHRERHPVLPDVRSQSPSNRPPRRPPDVIPPDYLARVCRVAGEAGGHSALARTQ
jgi:hypothetical protein